MGTLNSELTAQAQAGYDGKPNESLWSSAKYYTPNLRISEENSTPRFMVQVFDGGTWSDYWPVNAPDRIKARKPARAALSPFWRTRRWRIGPQTGVGV